MLTIRKKEGLHPFPWRQESEYDVLSTGHSSTSISAALGLAIAEQKNQTNNHVVAVIGDGAITAGMAFEAMNHAGHLQPNMLVILNDNDMSISENVGGLKQHLAQLLTSSAYSTLRENSKKIVSGIPPLKEFLKKTEGHLKGLVTPSTLFEELGFHYYGPIDGHNIEQLISVLRNLSQLPGPHLLHITTKKGKGYAPAEQDPIRWHGVPKFDPNDGVLNAAKDEKLTYSEVFGQWLCEVAAADNKLMAITPAMGEGSGMTQFAKQFPQQFFDVAIAEQHAVTLAAGMAIGGLKPVVAIYSTFLQRAYDQLIHDVALQNLPVMFAIDRAGVVGADGPTHQGAFDLSYLRCIPNLIIMTPSDENECRQMLNTAYHANQPCAVRYPRGKGSGATLQPLTTIEIGQAVVRREGENIAILNFGTLLPQAAIAADELNAALVDMRFVKPLDKQLLRRLGKEYDLLVSIEENAVAGGAGSAVNEFVEAEKLPCRLLNLGLPDEFIPQGEQQEILQQLGLDSDGIIKQIRRHNQQE